MKVIGCDFHPSFQQIAMRDAAQLLELMLQQRFPRIWTPSPKERDLRQLLPHRHKLVQAAHAAHAAARYDPELRRQYLRLAQRKPRAVATVAIARKLAVRL